VVSWEVIAALEFSSICVRNRVTRPLVTRTLSRRSLERSTGQRSAASGFVQTGIPETTFTQPPDRPIGVAYCPVVDPHKLPAAGKLPDIAVTAQPGQAAKFKRRPGEFDGLDNIAARMARPSSAAVAGSPWMLPERPSAPINFRAQALILKPRDPIRCRPERRQQDPLGP